MAMVPCGSPQSLDQNFGRACLIFYKFQIRHVRARSVWDGLLGERKRFAVVSSYPCTNLISAGTQSRSVAFALWHTILKR
eukprot:1949878-Rhodomonas_salina.1